MTSWGIIAVVAVALDLVVGDPRWFPHPVRGIGRLAMALERPTRRWIGSPKWAGIVTVAIVLAATALFTVTALEVARWIHPWAHSVVAVLVVWTTIASRDLMTHSRAVVAALDTGDTGLARQRVSAIVGRDTDELDEPQIVRAAVESVAESTVDGVTAPLFFAVLLGPLGAMLYRAINTLDSTFGYRNERYAEYGWASARLDDVANWLPARLTGPLMAVAAFLLRLRAGAALRILWRDRRKHPSPNAGWAESAMAGALGVQLGGRSSYGGVLKDKPLLGDPVGSLHPSRIEQANRLTLVTAALCVLVLLGGTLPWSST